MKSRVLLTGASGFVGNATLQVLSTDPNLEIYAVSRTKPMFLPDSVTWKSIDLTSYTDVQEYLAWIKPNKLVHAAWNTTHGDYWTCESNLVWVSASLNLLKAFKYAGGRRVLMVGTSAEYDWTTPPLQEDNSTIRPKSLYGVCKNALREIVESYCIQEELSWVWTRLFCVYGPMENPKKLFSKTAVSLINNELVGFTGGHEHRDFLHVHDVALAIVAVLGSGLSGPVNIGSGQAVSIREFVELVALVLGKSDMLVFKDDPNICLVREECVVASTIKLVAGTGWHARLPLAKGVKMACNDLLYCRQHQDFFQANNIVAE